MAFLSDLMDQLFSVGENTVHSFNTEDDGKYGALNEDFRKVFDQSAERSYVEEGYIRKDVVNLDSKQREILMQQPQATVLVKKRMFSSVAENYRPDLMDYDERLYFRACKFLFQNKCMQIAVLEKLSKIEKIVSATNNMDEQLMPLIFALADMFSSSGTLDNSEVSAFSSTIERLKKINCYNKSSKTTKWMTNTKDLLRSQLGQGTGVIEITNFTNLSTAVTNTLGKPGNLSLTIEDPYECMVISESDIEKAISDASNMFYESKTYLMSLNMSNELINNLTIRLNKFRISRNASPITFKINPDTLLGRRVTAIVDRTGQEIKFEFDYFKSIFSEGTSVEDVYYKGGELLGDDGLNNKALSKNVLNEGFGTNTFSAESELVIFKKLIDAIYNKLAIDLNSKNGLQIRNAKTNYVRKKLRFNFLGKLIIQPMDTIHAYISSQSSYDTKVLSGLKNSFNTLGALQSVMNGLTQLKKQFQIVFNPNSLNIAVERAVFAGKDFSPFLWSIMRSQFVNENEGVHVFAGIINRSSGSYQSGSGKFNVSVRASDNSEYLSMGKMIEKPGVDNWNGRIYDPLTPFKSKFDSVSSVTKQNIPELLNENKIILADSTQDAFVKYTQGPYAGKPAYDNNFISEKVPDGGTNEINKIVYAPNGLVYKWKEGIGVYTYQGSNFNFDTNSNVGIPRTTEDAFAGQDIMNTISMLITGQPYNFATYFSTISKWDGIGKDPQTQQSSATSYYNSLRNDLQKRNAIWGNFIPFKNLTVDEDTYVNTISLFESFKRDEYAVESRLNKLSNLESKNLILAHSHIFDQSLGKEAEAAKTQQQLIGKEASDLTSEIDDYLNSLSAKNSNEYFMESGSDILFNFDKFIESSENGKNLDSPEARRFIRKQINFLTRRMSYDVRANQDKNLFIVDDSYDKDYDITAFVSKLQNPGMYNSGFLDVKGKIIAVAELLGLEVFCDSQGHIRVRSPQYNRIPSSIFYKMMYQKRTMNIQIFPDFMNDLFNSQLETLKTRVEIIEDEIRLYAGILGKKSDEEISNFITSDTSVKGPSYPFSFISTVNASGKQSQISDITKLQEAGPNFSDNLKIENQAKNSRNLLNNKIRFDFLKERLGQAQYQSPSNPYNILEDTEENSIYINNIILRIERKSGQKIKKELFYKSYPEPFATSIKPKAKDIDIFKITKDLSQKVAERQKAIKIFYSALKNSMEFKSLDEDDKEKNTLLLFGTYGNKNIPQVFENLIEDESYDDLGPNSGKRYIIKNSQISSYEISENQPDFTTVQVNGSISQDIKIEPANIGSFVDTGGNGMTTAIAVDYDLWRNYGWKSVSTINAPFLTDKDSQCAPYAAAILSKARKNILRGSITIAGNEYMQVGDVVYLESRGLLFYVEGVQHSFSWGKSFSTILDLSYGHAVGEYIPNTLDFIGKLIYKNKDVSSYEVRKQFNCFNEEEQGVIIFDKQKKKDKPGKHDENNLTVMKNLLLTSVSILRYTKSLNKNKKAFIDLRVYYNKKRGPCNQEIISFAEEIKNILTGKDDTFLKMKNSKGNLINLNQDDIKITQVDLSEDQNYMSPSQKAWSVTRSLVDTEKFSQTVAPDKNAEDREEEEKLIKSKINKERKKLQHFIFNNIVDCFIKIE